MLALMCRGLFVSEVPVFGNVVGGLVLSMRVLGLPALGLWVLEPSALGLWALVGWQLFVERRRRGLRGPAVGVLMGVEVLRLGVASGAAFGVLRRHRYRPAGFFPN